MFFTPAATRVSTSTSATFLVFMAIMFPFFVCLLFGLSAFAGAFGTAGRLFRPQRTDDQPHDNSRRNLSESVKRPDPGVVGRPYQQNDEKRNRGEMVDALVEPQNCR